MTEHPRPYEPPSIVEIGTLHELTQGTKHLGGSETIGFLTIGLVS